MARSTGPILAVGAITYANQVIGNGRPWNSELIIPVATGIAAGLLALAEKASPELAVGIAWISLVTSLLLAPKGGRSAVVNLLRLTGLGGGATRR
jgi:hypothetical protein